MKIESTRFERSAFGAEHEPALRWPLVVFLGRSNVGKSSLINRLLGTKGLARTSSTPGRTQSVNFYAVNESLYFVDLPGYGYARVPEPIRRQWQPMVEGFLDRRAAEIAIAVLVVDARREPQEKDLLMREWLEARSIHHLVAATKLDKLARGAAARSIAAIRRAYPERENGAGTVHGVSSQTGSGVGPLWGEIDRALSGTKRVVER